MTFAHPNFLFGLFAITIPIVIHLFDLQKPKKIVFNNVSLLNAISKKTSSARKIKDWLILVSRILAIIFIIFALAQPIFNTKNGLNQESKLQFFVDNSPSMQIQGLLNESINKVEKWISASNKNVRFRYLDQSFLPKDNIWLTQSQLKDRLSETGIVGKSHSFNDVLKKLNITNTVQNNSINILLSDFQKCNTINTKNLPIDTNSQTIIVPMANKTISNVFVDSVWTENIFVRENEKNKLFVSLKNVSKSKTIKLKLRIDNIQTGMINANIDTKSKAVVAFNFSLTSSKPSTCELLIENDEVDFDNKFYFVLYPTQKVKILNITHLQDSYIKKVYASEKSFAVLENKFGLLSQAELSKSDFIIVEGLDKLKQNECVLLKEYMESGKQLLVFPSEKSNKNTINTSLSYFGWLPVNYLENVNMNDKNLHIDFPDITNPLFKNIFEKVDKQADMPYIKPMFEILDKSNILLKTTSKDAFISYKKIGNGTMFLCTTPLYDSYTNWMRHAMFVPLMYKIALSSIKNAPPLAYSLDDNLIKIPIKITNSEKTIRITNDKISYMVQPIPSSTMLQFELPPNLPNPGIYKVLLNDTLNIPIALNLSKNEGILEYYSAAELGQLFVNYTNVKVISNENIDSHISVIKSDSFGFPIWKYCLIISLLFLLFEIILIRYFK